VEERPSQLRAALHSVGCKLNQFELEILRQDLEDRGYTIVDFEQVADVYVLNTCTVTSRTDRECRRLARGARRRNPSALVVLTGCYAEIAAEDLHQLGVADLIVGNRQKFAVPALIDERLRNLPVSKILAADSARAPLLREFSGHTRAFVKAQEGCAGGCAYCIIARARGPERSVPSQRVLEQVQLLAEKHPEIVLIGTHLGRYGRDLAGEMDLSQLVEEICTLPELSRLRLSSLEPTEVTPQLSEQVVAGGRCLPPEASRPAQGKLCRHLHIPLQSGCDSVLRRMSRPYDTESYARLVYDLKQRQPGLCLGADVIAGFPGETEDEFATTRDFLEVLPLSYLHVFTYSPRPGTPASDLPDQVPPEVRKQRNHVLRALSERKRAEFTASQIGERLELVLEPGDRAEEVYGLSDNYLRVTLDQADLRPGQLIAVRVTGSAGGILQGVIENFTPGQD